MIKLWPKENFQTKLISTEKFCYPTPMEMYWNAALVLAGHYSTIGVNICEVLPESIGVPICYCKHFRKLMN